MAVVASCGNCVHSPGVFGFVDSYSQEVSHSLSSIYVVSWSSFSLLVINFVQNFFALSLK